MPQLLLPILPPESTSISPLLGICVRGTECTYYLGQLAVFTHARDNLANFRMITSQMVIQGSLTLLVMTPRRLADCESNKPTRSL